MKNNQLVADLGFPDAEELKVKSDLGRAIFLIIEERKLTQSQAATILGVKQQEVSRIKQGKFPHYSVERLLTFLSRFGRDIEIHIRDAHHREGTMDVIDLAQAPQRATRRTSRPRQRKNSGVPARV